MEAMVFDFWLDKCSHGFRYCVCGIHVTVDVYLKMDLEIKKSACLCDGACEEKDHFVLFDLDVEEFDGLLAQVMVVSQN